MPEVIVCNRLQKLYENISQITYNPVEVPQTLYSHFFDPF